MPLKNARVWLWGCVSAEVYCVLLQPSCKYLYVQNTGPVCRVSEFLFGIAAKINGRSGSEDDIASGVGYDPPDGSRDLDLGFLVPLPSGFNPGEFRLVGSIGNWCTPPLRGSQGRRGSFLLRGA